MIYLDNNATTQLLPSVKQKMIEFLEYNQSFNVSAIHDFGRKAKYILEQARSDILQIAAPSYKMVFVPSATIANNIIIKNFKNVVVSSVEHSSVAKNQNIIINVDKNGYIDIDHLISLIKSIQKPFLVSVIHGHNETGVVNDIAKICELVHNFGGLLHTDAVQSFGKIISNLSELNADYYTIAAHKIGGPVGAAALIYKKSVEPLIVGGGQESGMQAGTENLLAIIGFAEAVKNINIQNYQEKVLPLKNLLEEGLENAGSIIIAKNSLRLPNTIMVSNAKMSNKSQIISCDMAGFAISIGSACSSGTVKSSATLLAMNIDDKVSNCAIRVSLGLQNNINDIERFIDFYKNS